MGAGERKHGKRNFGYETRGKRNTEKVTRERKHGKRTNGKGNMGKEARERKHGEGTTGNAVNTRSTKYEVRRDNVEPNPTTIRQH